jgi:NTP pyrophosphatase (non-canonical NTP hydrolase)
MQRIKRKKQQRISKFIKECHSVARKKGWWDSERNDGELIALMHSELSEALEAMRNHGTKDNIAEELADCCIRIFDYCGARDIDLEKVLLKKIEYNKTRPYRHGKKF